eukprot:2554130-Rhodomonas_salina.2
MSGIAQRRCRVKGEIRPQQRCAAPFLRRNGAAAAWLRTARSMRCGERARELKGQREESR